MFYLFLDESGDLGFDFNKPGTTKYFVETVLLLPDTAAKRAMEKAVERTIKYKISVNRKDRSSLELKGAKTDFHIKQYFLRQCEKLDFGIYAVILDKKLLPNRLTLDKSRLYNFLARQVIDEAPLPEAPTRVIITIDKSQAPHEIQALNRSLIAQVQAKIDPHWPLEIFHMKSHEVKGLQAVDMFSWGVFRKYEDHDTAWYDLCAGRIRKEINLSSIK